jgi:hypothetical protein
VAEDSGDVRECARWSTAGAGRAELIGEAHGAEREDGRVGATARCLAEQAREAEGRGARGRGNRRRQPGATGQRGREGGSARGQKLPLTGGAHLSGGAGARARSLAGPVGLLCLFLFLWIS